MSLATKLSRVVFVLLLLSTFLGFFAAQRLKHSDSLVYAVNFDRYISPDGDGAFESGNVRFSTKRPDRVSVEVIDRTGRTVRVLADDRWLPAGRHTFRWDGRYPPTRENGRKRRGEAVADGYYRVRISLRNRGRSFVPGRYFIVDTEPPAVYAQVRGRHSRSILRERTRVAVVTSKMPENLRAEFLVYRVNGSRASVQPVASFMSRYGTSRGLWDQTVGSFSSWSGHCRGVKRRGRARPAPTGSYVIVARVCDRAGNIGTSTRGQHPTRENVRGRSGVTLTGVQIAPPVVPARAGSRIKLRVAAPTGGYTWRLSGNNAARVRGKARGPRLYVKLPKHSDGLHTLTIKANRPVAGDRGYAMTPLTVSGGSAKLLVVQPAISWQAANPVDIDGDGFPDPFESLPDGRQVRVSLTRFLARASGPPGFAGEEGSLTGFVDLLSGVTGQTTTDAALARSPEALLRGKTAVLFTGDERWLPAAAGTALRKFVEDGGKVAFTSLSGFRRTVTLTQTQLIGPSEPRGRNIFGEASSMSNEAAAPVVPFVDELDLLFGPTGLFTGFEQSRLLPSEAEVLTSAGRLEKSPALVAYKLGKGMVIRVGVRGWSAQIFDDDSVRLATTSIIEQLVGGPLTAEQVR